MKTILNYIGQLRIYSLIDLFLLLVATKATKAEFVGALCLHVGFLAYLESRHSHTGRQAVPRWLWLLFVLVGALFYQRIETIPFVVCSFLYTKKNENGWGVASPFFRGLQMFFLVAGISGYGSFLPWIAFLVLTTRNFVGDLRDVKKDKREGMRTLPVVIGVVEDLKCGHMIAMTMSTFVWWSCSGLPVGVLLGAVLAQIATYNLTPR